MCFNELEKRSKKTSFLTPDVSWTTSSALGPVTFFCPLPAPRLFFIALGLHCCARGFSSCGEQGLCGVQASHWGGFSCCGAQAQYLWCIGLVAPWHAGIFPDQGSNLFLLHWQADSLPGKPQNIFFLWMVNFTEECQSWSHLEIITHQVQIKH